MNQPLFLNLPRIELKPNLRTLQHRTSHREVLGTYGGDCEDFFLLVCDAVLSGASLPTSIRTLVVGASREGIIGNFV